MVEFQAEEQVGKKVCSGDQLGLIPEAEFLKILP